MKPLIHRSIALALVALFGACGGPGNIGDECGKEQDADECVGGALCAKTSAGTLLCQQVCTDQKDCPAGNNCNGTTGPQKVCQPK